MLKRNGFAFLIVLVVLLLTTTVVMELQADTSGEQGSCCGGIDVTSCSKCQNMQYGVVLSIMLPVNSVATCLNGPFYSQCVMVRQPCYSGTVNAFSDYDCVTPANAPYSALDVNYSTLQCDHLATPCN